MQKQSQISFTILCPLNTHRMQTESEKQPIGWELDGKISCNKFYNRIYVHFGVLNFQNGYKFH